jgi:hypothetical protein
MKTAGSRECPFVRTLGATRIIYRENGSFSRARGIGLTGMIREAPTINLFGMRAALCQSTFETHFREPINSSFELASFDHFDSAQSRMISCRINT